MATVSKSAAEFMRRNGMIPTPRSPSPPRLATGRLRVHTIPLDATQLNAHHMLDAGGDPPTDRGKTDPWPPPQEVGDATGDEG